MGLVCARTMVGAMVVIVQYTVYQRSPINQWSAGTTVVETSASYSFNDLAAAIEKHMKLQAGTLMPYNVIGIFENKLVADKSSVLSRTGGPVQVCIAERSAVMLQQFPATATA